MIKLLLNEFKGFSVGKNMQKTMLVIATALLLTAPLRAEQFIVKDGKANAEIIV